MDTFSSINNITMCFPRSKCQGCPPPRKKRKLKRTIILTLAFIRARARVRSNQFVFQFDCNPKIQVVVTLCQCFPSSHPPPNVDTHLTYLQFERSQHLIVTTFKRISSATSTVKKLSPISAGKKEGKATVLALKEPGLAANLSCRED